MCRAKEQGGRRCRAHQKEWQELTVEEQEQILRMEEELRAAKKRSERLTVRVTPHQQSWLQAEKVTPDVAHARVVGTPFLTERTLPQVIAASEAAALNATEQQNATHPGHRTPSAGHAASTKLYLSFTKDEDAAMETEAAGFGLPKAEYARKQLIEEDVRRHPLSMGKDARQVREAWLNIPDDERREGVRERVTAEQEMARCKYRMREIERVIILKRGTGNDEDYAAVGEAMREKGLLKLDLEQLEEQHAVVKQQEREATLRREQSIQKLRTALNLSMQALRLVKSNKHTEAFILGLGAVAVGAAAHRASRAA